MTWFEAHYLLCALFMHERSLQCIHDEWDSESRASHTSGVWIGLNHVLHSQLPPNGTVCEVDADFDVFDGVNTADILANIPGTDV